MQQDSFLGLQRSPLKSLPQGAESAATMPNSLKEDQDQRKNTGSEDSTAMTVEFLRARLSSERSVSRTARQRAEELARRVAELEEQLKTVSLQRKKAEKATADVLAILENRGLSDVSEAFDSCSDQEATLCKSKVGSSFVKEEETSANVKIRRNGVDAFSGSDPESSTLNGRSLSWKSSEDSLHSLEKKFMDSSRRRRSTYASTGSSSPRRVGKSCRQIRRRESRSAVEELHIDTSMPAQGDEVATCPECFPNCSDIRPETLKEGSENREENTLLDGPVSGVLENQRATSVHYLNGNGADRDMERALEHQAQLIGQYEAEEKAQTEWEEKFRENNGSTTDPCDPGNHSDVTEERDEIKGPAPPCHTETIASQNQEAKLGAIDVCFSKGSKTPNGFQPHPPVDMGRIQDKKGNTTIAYETPASEFAFSMETGKHDHECSGNHRFPPLHSSQHRTDSQSTPGSHSAHASRVGSNLSKGETSSSTNEFALIPHDTSDKLGSVLQALQLAKLSLKQNLNRLPLLERGSTGKAIEPSGLAVTAGERLDMPVGHAGLFSLPTDFQFEAATRANFLSSGSQLSLANYSPDPASNKFFPSPYINSRSGTSTDDHFLTVPTFPYAEIRSGVPSRSTSLNAGLPSSSKYTYLDPHLTVGPPPSSSKYTYLDPHLSVGPPPSSSKYTYLDPHLSVGPPPSSSRYTYPTHPFYPDLMPRMPSDEGLANSLPSREVGIPPETQFSFYDHTRPNNMYR